MKLLITGGAGFIGSNLARIAHAAGHEITVVDKLTYAGNMSSLVDLLGQPRFTFIQADICDAETMRRVFAEARPDKVLHLAAESHVDRSIHGPGEFIQTNIVGTFHLLEATRAYWGSLAEEDKKSFRFLHVSTDEVYGSLKPENPAFKETNTYEPNSPYSASKAASDHLVRAYHHTYGLPVLTTNCSNNYGPYQFPEKLIPLMICNAVSGKALPVYGDGKNIRDWLYVGDHCAAICDVLRRGQVGEVYNIGGGNEIRNIDIVQTICAILDDIKPRGDGHSYKEQIAFVEDRKGHDKRYAVDTTKITSELGWKPEHIFAQGLKETIEWYLSNDTWIRSVLSEE